jgi:hypothetical protein
VWLFFCRGASLRNSGKKKKKIVTSLISTLDLYMLFFRARLILFPDSLQKHVFGADRSLIVFYDRYPHADDRRTVGTADMFL